MNLRVAVSSFLLSLLLAALPLSSTADDDETVSLYFEGAGCFSADYSSYPLIHYFGTDVVELEGLGTATIDWNIDAQLTPTGLSFVDGDFVMDVEKKKHRRRHSPRHESCGDDDDDDDDDGNTLAGVYTDFQVDPFTGAYTLDWLFTSGTGDFEDAAGDGQTLGLVNLATLCAEFEFAGEVSVDD